MPEQLKIIIDADVNKAIAGVQNLSKVITTDFIRATNSASVAASSLSAEVAASVQKINASLSGLKVTSLDIAVNTSSIDASISSIRQKFAALVDPQINVLANTELAEVKIRELLADLSALKGSQIFITANDTQALKAINEIETELNSLVDKQIRLNINSTEAVQKINFLEKELLHLQTLSVAPNISSTQLALFEANIKRIKGEIASLKGQGVVIPIEANTTLAQKNVNLLSETIETLRAKAEAKKFFITTETDITKIAAYNKEIQKLESQVRQLQNVGKKGFELFIVPNQTINSVKSLTQSVAAFGGGVRTFIPPAIAGFNKLPSTISPVITQLKALERQAVTTGAATTNSFSKAFQGLRGLAAIIPGIGLGGLIGLAATAVDRLTNGFFEAAFGAGKFRNAIDAAAQSIDKEAASVITMVRALQSGSLTSEEFRKVKAQLIAQAPEFQKSFDGDKISIEASELALQNYIKQLANTIRVTAALAIVNDTLAESLATIVKGSELSGAKRLIAKAGEAFGLKKEAKTLADNQVKAVQEALESFKPENISKLLDETFKKLGITFKDFAGTIDTKALEANLAKVKAAFEKFQNETISKAQAFKKQFGDTFVLPDLEVSFFVDKNEIFRRSLGVLEQVRKDLASRSTIKELKIKLPVLVESGQITETVTKDIQSLNKVISLLKPVELKTTGNLDELKKQLEGLDSKEISISIKQTGDVKKIAEQLTSLKGVEIPILVKQEGDIKKIVNQLSGLKGVDIPIKITGEVQSVINQLSKIKDVDLRVNLNEADALKRIEELTKGKQLPILVDQNGIIFSITKAVDGAIKIVRTKTIKIPIVTETDIKILENITKEVELSKDVIDSFFKGIAAERNIPVTIIPDITLSKGNLDLIDKKLDLRKKFAVLGDLGLAEFAKIDFSNMNRGLEEATRRLQGMMEIATTINQAVGHGMVNAFNSVFDAVLEGKSVFKALANAVKQLVVDTIKAIAQMLILRIITKAIFPAIGFGGGVAGGAGASGSWNSANFGQLSGIGSRAFQPVIQITGTTSVSGDHLITVFNRASNSQGRFG